MGDMDEAQFRAYLRALTYQVGGIKKWALEHDVSWQYVSNVIHDRRPPGEKILRATGYERVVIYRPVAFTDPEG